jgi:hypothetical protein
MTMPVANWRSASYHEWPTEVNRFSHFEDDPEGCGGRRLRLTGARPA